MRAKWIVFFLPVLSALILVSCGADTDRISDDTSFTSSSLSFNSEVDVVSDSLSSEYTISPDGIVMNFLDTVNTIYKSDKNYAIYTDGFSFRYTVNDNNGNLLDMGYHNYRGSFDLYYQGDLLVLDYGYGGNTGASERYYDVEHGRISPFFSSPIALSDTRVAYFVYREQNEKNALIIQDIFDPSDYYTEIERDFASGPILYTSEATFLDNSTKLQITYPFGIAEKGKPVEYKTEVLSLP